MSRGRRRLGLDVSAIVTLLCAAALPGCSAYELRGRAVEGTASAMVLVDEDDPRLLAPPVGRVTIESVLDPTRPDRRRLPATGTLDTGDFAIPIDAAGAGLLTYDIRVLARGEGYAPAEAIVPVPGSGKRLLVVLGPGSGGRGLERDVVEESLRFRGVFER